MLNVGVLISGRGSNLRSLLAACAEPGFPARIVCVISNKASAKGLDYAREAGIPAIVISHKDYCDRQSFDAAIDAEFQKQGVQMICLAGFMRILTAWFVERWRDRLINIHPSLLPSFPGEHVHEQVLAYGSKISGCTVHFVRPEMDRGPIVIQAAVPVLDGDTAETLGARVLQTEHKAYPAALRMIAENRVNVLDERIFIVDATVPEDALFNPKP